MFCGLFLLVELNVLRNSRDCLCCYPSAPRRDLPQCAGIGQHADELPIQYPHRRQCSLKLAANGALSTKRFGNYHCALWPYVCLQQMGLGQNPVQWVDVAFSASLRCLYVRYNFPNLLPLFVVYHHYMGFWFLGHKFKLHNSIHAVTRNVWNWQEWGRRFNPDYQLQQ